MVGFDPTPMSRDEFTDHIKKSVNAKVDDLANKCAEFCEICYYISLKTDEGDKSFEELRDLMESFKHEDKEQHRIFYMALPPTVYVPVSEQLARCCKNEKGVSRIIVGCLSIGSSDRALKWQTGRETFRQGYRNSSRSTQEARTKLE